MKPREYLAGKIPPNDWRYQNSVGLQNHTVSKLILMILFGGNPMVNTIVTVLKKESNNGR